MDWYSSTEQCCSSRALLWVRQLLICRKFCNSYFPPSSFPLYSLLPSSLLYPPSLLPPSLPPSFFPPDYLSSSVDEFTQASLTLWADIQQAIATNLTMSENIVRIINNKLMNIERAFIHPTGLPGRPLIKYALFCVEGILIPSGNEARLRAATKMAW